MGGATRVQGMPGSERRELGWSNSRLEDGRDQDGIPRAPCAHAAACDVAGWAVSLVVAFRPTPRPQTRFAPTMPGHHWATGPGWSRLSLNQVSPGFASKSAWLRLKIRSGTAGEQGLHARRVLQVSVLLYTALMHEDSVTGPAQGAGGEGVEHSRCLPVASVSAFHSR